VNHYGKYGRVPPSPLFRVAEFIRDDAMVNRSLSRSKVRSECRGRTRARIVEREEGKIHGIIAVGHRGAVRRSFSRGRAVVIAVQLCDNATMRAAN